MEWRATDNAAVVVAIAPMTAARWPASYHANKTENRIVVSETPSIHSKLRSDLIFGYWMSESEPLDDSGMGAVFVFDRELREVSDGLL